MLIALFLQLSAILQIYHDYQTCWGRNARTVITNWSGKTTPFGRWMKIKPQCLCDNRGVNAHQGLASEWLLLNVKWTFLSAISWREQITFRFFDEMMMMSALYYTNTLRWIFIVLAHWNNSLRVDMSLHSIPNQPVFALYSWVYRA
jgi:hypothetical protein